MACEYIHIDDCMMTPVGQPDCPGCEGSCPDFEPYGFGCDVPKYCEACEEDGCSECKLVQEGPEKRIVGPYWCGPTFNINPNPPPERLFCKGLGIGATNTLDRLYGYKWVYDCFWKNPLPPHCSPPPPPPPSPPSPPNPNPPTNCVGGGKGDNGGQPQPQPPPE